MSELNILISSIEYLYISPQSYFLVFFTILAIIATVLAIATSLTKEQKQDVFIDYFFKDKFIVFYLAFIMISFLFPFCLYICCPSNPPLSLMVTFLLMINFVLTFGFLLYFINSLKRKSVYNKILKDFKGEINE